MQVALINHDYPPFIFGGIGNFVSELAKGLSRQGVKVYVITGYPKHHRAKVPYRVVEDGIEVFRFPFPPIPPRHTAFQLCNYKAIQKLLQSLNVDVIHGQCGASYPLIGNLKKLAPVMVTFHGSPLYEKIFSTQSIVRGGSRQDFSTYLLGYPAWHFTYKKELKYCTSAVAVSKSLKEELLTEMGQKYDKKISYIWNGIDFQSLDASYVGDNSDDLESEDSILFAGRLFWRKGALNVIKLANILQQNQSTFKIIVHGTGPLYCKMQNYIRLFGLKNITLKGFTSKQELMRSFRKCKFLAIPSVYESCPMILLEGMCLGKIPLLLDQPFSNELTLKGKYGVLGSDIKNLSERLLNLQNTHAIDEYSKEIKTFARNSFDIAVTAKKYVGLYGTCIKNSE